MAKNKKYIAADDALDEGLKLEVAPYAPKEIVADSQGRYVGQNGLTASDLDMVGTGQYFNNTDWNKMGPGYSIVTNPYQAASPEQIADRQQGSQVSTNRNDLELMGDEAYNQILKYQQDWANATTDAERAAAHEAAEAIRAKYGYSGGADGSEYLGLMAYTGGLGYDDVGAGLGGGGSSGFSYDPYLSKYQARIDALADAIMNRDPFSYNKDTDPLYQQYKESYTRGGQRGMQDTLAQVSARTGGLASSYAESAAQQTYNNYMAELANKVPELYQLAYSMYMDDLSQDRADLSMLQGLDDTAYGRWSDALNFDYGMYRDGVSDSQWQQQFDYGVSRDQVADSQWQQSFDYQKEQDALAQQNWQTQWDYQLQQDALAREDALAKLTSGGGVPDTPDAPTSIIDTIFGMDNEAQVYDYLVSQDLSATEAENYMTYWYVNQDEKAAAGTVDNTEGLALLREMEKDNASVQELYDMLTELYRNGLITEEAYNRRLDRYRVK